MASGGTKESLEFFPNKYENAGMVGNQGGGVESLGEGEFDGLQTSTLRSSTPYYDAEADYGGDVDFGDNGDPYANEPPLLEEMGISIPHIRRKTMAVLNPFNQVDAHILDDTDMAGPFFFCILFGVFLMMSGKLHFGYIYGFGGLGCGCMFLLLNLMSERGIDFYKTVSILGYCMLPMVFLAGLSVVVVLNGPIGMALAALAIAWCTRSASMMFVQGLELVEQKALIMYPVGLLYVCFGLLAIFD